MQWDRLLRWMFRDVFDPMAYAAGLQAIWEEGPKRAVEASEIPCFREHVWPYWELIAVQCERAHESGLAEADDALDEIVTQLRGFLSHLGAELSKKPVGCWVDFPSRFLRWRMLPSLSRPGTKPAHASYPQIAAKVLTYVTGRSTCVV